jgi:signal transduction histidine kinase
MAEDGTGLGLALVDEVARAHGWRVEMSEGIEVAPGGLLGGRTDR